MKNPFTFYCYCFKVQFSPSEISSGISSTFWIFNHSDSTERVLLVYFIREIIGIVLDLVVAYIIFKVHEVYSTFLLFFQQCQRQKTRACRQLTRIRLSEHTSMHTSIQSISNSSAKHHNQKPTYIRHPQIKIYAYLAVLLGPESTLVLQIFPYELNSK